MRVGTGFVTCAVALPVLVSSEASPNLSFRRTRCAEPVLAKRDLTALIVDLQGYTDASQAEDSARG